MKKLIYRVLHHPMLHKQTVVQATFAISLMNLLSKAIGYFREMLVAYFFGASGLVDAFVVGMQIPQVFMGIIAGGIGIIIIPMYLSIKKEYPEDAKRYVNQIIVVWGILFAFVSIVIAIFAPILVHYIALGFRDDYRFILATQITRYLSIFGFLSIMTSLFNGLLQAEKSFFIPALVTALANVSNIFFLVIFYRIFGIYSLGIGYLAMSLITFSCFIFILRTRFNLLQNFNLSIKWNEIKIFLLLLVPLMISIGAEKINIIVDRAIASKLAEGSIAAINYSTKIWTIPIVLFSSALTISIFPQFSLYAIDKGKVHEYKLSINKTLLSVYYVLVPFTVLIYIFALVLVRLFYQRGAFSTESTRVTAQVVQMYSLGLIGTACFPIIVQIFYSFKKTVTPLMITVALVLVNIGGSIVLSKFFQASGIALATSISKSLGFIVAYFFLAKFFRTFQDQSKQTNYNLLIEFAKIVLSAFLMSLGAICMNKLLIFKHGFFLDAVFLGLEFCLLLLIYYLLSKIFKSKACKIVDIYLATVFKITKLCKKY